MRLPLFPVLLTLVLGTFALPAHADASVEARLKARGVKYEVDKDGDYQITISYSDEDRTQLAFVSGGTERIRGFAVREIFSPAGRVSRDGINGAKALELLGNSRASKIGAWEIGGDILYYVIKLPDDASAAEIEEAIGIAAEAADDMEIKLSGKADLF